MSEIKVGDKVFTNQMSLQPLKPHQIARYTVYKCPITKKMVRQGVSKTGQYDVMVRDWDENPNWVVVKITPKRVGVVRHNNLDMEPTFLAHHFVKKEGAN